MEDPNSRTRAQWAYFLHGQDIVLHSVSDKNPPTRTVLMNAFEPRSVEVSQLSGLKWDDWRASVSELFHGLEVGVRPQDNSTLTRLKYFECGGVTVCNIRGPEQLVKRSSSATRNTETDQIGVMRIDAGCTNIEQGGRRLSLQAGDVILFSNALPYTFEMLGPMGHSLILFHRSSFQSETRSIDRFGLTRLEAGTSRRMLSVALRQLVAGAPSMRFDELQNLGSPMLQLALACLRTGQQGNSSMARQKVSQSLLDRIRADIRDSLHDPKLSPSWIALKHGISLRYLHKLFASDGGTMMGFVREERLAGCLREMRSCSSRPHIGAISARWGFEDEGSFRRAFRMAYGQPPSRLLRDGGGVEVPTHGSL